jgi:hypothetical protein
MGAAQHAGIFLPAVRVIALGLALLVANLALAAPPDATSLFPAGGTIGSTVSVTATGTFNAWPVRILCSEPLVQVECDKTKGKLTINIPQETPPGVVWLRFVDDEGASAPRPFIVSSLPSLLEKEPNNTPVQAQALTSSSVIDGKFDKSGDVDVYRVELEAGQTLVASLLAHQILGSAADGALQICSAEGDVLAMNQDASGLDPLLTFKAPAAGTYQLCRGRSVLLPAHHHHGAVCRLHVADGRDALGDAPLTPARLERAGRPGGDHGAGQAGDHSLVLGASPGGGIASAPGDRTAGGDRRNVRDNGGRSAHSSSVCPFGQDFAAAGNSPLYVRKERGSR